MDPINTIIAIGGALTTLYGGWLFLKKKVITPIKERLDKLDKLDKITETLQPNGGKSLYDHILKIERKLAFSDVRGKILVSNLNIGEWQSDEKGNCTFINSAACRLLNRSESEFYGSNWINIVWDEDRERVVNEWEEVVAGKRNFEMRYSWKHSEGYKIKILATAYPISDSFGTISGWVGVVRLDNSTELD